MTSVFILILSLALLMVAAYRGASVILFAPICALLAVTLTDPGLAAPMLSGVFMVRLSDFVQLYFPVFLLGAVFGKLIEISGFARALIGAVTEVVGPSRAMLAVVLVCALLTYGGVSLFVVAFAVYPFAAELFRSANIPKRLIPGTIALGAFTFTMDALPGSPQIQNIIPASFFGTDTWAAPRIGLFGAAIVLGAGLAYLEWRRRRAAAAGEGYGAGHLNESGSPYSPAAQPGSPAAQPGSHAAQPGSSAAQPGSSAAQPGSSGAQPGSPAVHPGSAAVLPSPLVAALPLFVVGALNRLFTDALPRIYGPTVDLSSAGIKGAEPILLSKVAAIWAIEGALAVGCLLVLALAFRRVKSGLAAGAGAAVSGALLATLNTASEYGFGAVVAALPGFQVVSAALAGTFGNPLINVAVTTTTLAGITGSASGGMSIALGAMGQAYLQQAAAIGIPPEMLHRIAAMASGGMDTLPHNGAVITLLAITGLTHRQSYPDIFAMTLIKTFAVFAAIAFFTLTGTP
ncbi:MAG: GntP family permease [Candidatus Sericytochromatia bacterium]|nr:GntP family permease [Candidatus Tanganyikabacteria bacterium]